MDWNSTTLQIIHLWAEPSLNFCRTKSAPVAGFVKQTGRKLPEGVRVSLQETQLLPPTRACTPMLDDEFEEIPRSPDSACDFDPGRVLSLL